MNGTLPYWLQRILGLDAAAGEGAAWSVEFYWPWPPWLTFVLIAAAACFVLRLYWRENKEAGRFWKFGLAAVRLAILGVVLLMISQATLLLKRTSLPYLAVLVDDSQSMGIVDRYDADTEKRLPAELKKADLGDQLSRLNLAKNILLRKDSALLRSIQKEHKLRLYSLTSGAIGAAEKNAAADGHDLSEIIRGVRSLQPLAPSTRLGVGVESVLDDLRGTAPAAVIIFSDGVNTEGQGLADAADAARRRGVPLFTIGTGDSRPPLDLKISDLMVDEVVFVDDIVSFEFKLAAEGFQGREVEVLLKENGKPETLAAKKITIAGDGKTQTVRMQYRPPKEGEFRYSIEATPLEGELQTENNTVERVVRVCKEKIRVLLAAAYPNYEYRYLRNMLARDNSIELDSLLQDADVRAAEQDAAALGVFPVRREELFHYDVIILDDAATDLLGEASMNDLAAFVTDPAKGGALIVIAGPRNIPQRLRDTPLAPLLPVKIGGVDPGGYPGGQPGGYPGGHPGGEAGFTMQPTELGLANPAMQLGDTPNETLQIWRDLPPLYWMTAVPEVKMGAMVLAADPQQTGPEGQPLPIILMQYVGAGKVLFHATDETWRWRWRAGDTFFARYWMQMIRYLARSKLFGGDGRAVLASDRREYRPGQPIQIRLRFTDPRLAPADDRGATVVVEQQGRQTHTLNLTRSAAQGVFEGVLTAASPGQCHVWLAAPSLDGPAPAVDFEILPPVGEFENIRMDEKSLAQAAAETKGRFFPATQCDRLLDDLPPGRQVQVAALPPRPLWNSVPVILLLLTLLIAEWIGRKMKGMA